MSIASLRQDALTNLPFYEERVDLACAFRWTVRLNMHEAVANHFSLAVSDDGTKFALKPPDTPAKPAAMPASGWRPAEWKISPASGITTT